MHAEMAIVRRTREEELSEFTKGHKYLIIKGIHKVGKSRFMEAMTDLYSKYDKKIAIYEKKPQDLKNAFAKIIKEIEEKLSEKLNRRIDIDTNKKNIIEIFTEAGGKNGLEVYVFIDEVHISEEDKSLLEDIANRIPEDVNFYLILAPTNWEFNALYFKSLRIRCFKDKTAQTGIAFTRCGDALGDYHSLYRGHPGFIEEALKVGSNPSKLSTGLIGGFTSAKQTIDNFINRKQSEPHLYMSFSLALEFLYNIFYVCEKICENEDNDFNGVTREYIKSLSNLFPNLLNFQNNQSKADAPRFKENIDGIASSVEEAIDDIFKELFNENAELEENKLLEYLEREKECIKLYPLLNEWLCGESNLKCPCKREIEKWIENLKENFEELCKCQL